MRQRIPNDPRGTKRWKVLRKGLLSRFPVCEGHGCTRVANEVHHVVPVRHDPTHAYAYDHAYLRCLCHECHVKADSGNIRYKPRKPVDAEDAF